MTDINEQFPESQVFEVDWDAPEAGSSFPPPVPPGTYEFIFHLPPEGADAFTLQEVKDASGNLVAKVPQVNFNVELLASVDGDGASQPVPADTENKQPVVRFQRASLYKSDKMPISAGAELLRSLGLVEELKAITGGSVTKEAFETVLKQADGRVRGIAEFKWTAFFKATNTTVSTSPRKTRRGKELPWPRKADNSLEDMAIDPATKEKAYGRLEISRYKIKKG